MRLSVRVSDQAFGVQDLFLRQPWERVLRMLATIRENRNNNMMNFDFFRIKQMDQPFYLDPKRASDWHVIAGVLDFLTNKLKIKLVTSANFSFVLLLPYVFFLLTVPSVRAIVLTRFMYNDISLLLYSWLAHTQPYQGSFRHHTFGSGFLSLVLDSNIPSSVQLRLASIDPFKQLDTAKQLCLKVVDAESAAQLVLHVNDLLNNNTSIGVRKLDIANNAFRGNLGIYNYKCFSDELVTSSTLEPVQGQLSVAVAFGVRTSDSTHLLEFNYDVGSLSSYCSNALEYLISKMSGPVNVGSETDSVPSSVSYPYSRRLASNSKATFNLVKREGNRRSSLALPRGEFKWDEFIYHLSKFLGWRNPPAALFST
jgi:hypothetical protein